MPVSAKAAPGIPLVTSPDSAFTIQPSDRQIYMPAQTAARVGTLPLASSVPLGTRILLQGGTGTSGTNTISVARAGSDTINGAASNVVVVNAAWGKGVVVAVGPTAWAASVG